MPRKEIVTRVIDGDTFETTNRKHPVRLANINTPEKREKGYQSAKAALERMIKGKEVSIDTVARDTFNRSVAKVKLGPKSVNAAMKKQGK